MRTSSVLMFLAAVVFGLFAVVGVKAYLDNQRAQIAAMANAPRPAEHTIVVAARNLRFGALIEGADLKEIEWAADQLPPGSFERIGQIVNDNGKRYALGAIAVNEPVISTKISEPGQRATLSTTLAEGKKAVTIRVNDVLGVAGFVLPGDLVDIMLTRVARSASNATQPYVDVLLQGIKVLAIDQLADEQTDKPSVVRTVTFEVDTVQAQKLALGSQVGTLSLALRNASEEGPESVRRITIEDLDAINPDAVRERAEQAEADAARVETLRRMEEMMKAMESKLDKADMTAEQVRAEMLKLMDERLKAENKPANATPVQTRRSLRIGVSRGGARTEYTLDN